MWGGGSLCAKSFAKANGAHFNGGPEQSRKNINITCPKTKKDQRSLLPRENIRWAFSWSLSCNKMNWRFLCDFYFTFLSRPGKSLLDPDGDLHYEGGMEILDGTCQVNRHGNAEVGYRLHVNRRSRSHETPLSLALNDTTFANQKSQLFRSTEWCMLGDMEILDDFCGVQFFQIRRVWMQLLQLVFQLISHLKVFKNHPYLFAPRKWPNIFAGDFFLGNFYFCVQKYGGSSIIMAMAKFVKSTLAGSICTRSSLVETWLWRDQTLWLFWLTCFNL